MNPIDKLNADVNSYLAKIIKDQETREEIAADLIFMVASKVIKQ